MAFKMRGSTFYGKGNQSPVKHHKKDEDGNVIHSGHDDKPYGSTDPEYIKKKEESADLFLKGKTKDKDGNIVDIKWAPGPARPKKYKDPYDKVVTKKKSPNKTKIADHPEDVHNKDKSWRKKYDKRLHAPHNRAHDAGFFKRNPDKHTHQ